MGFFNKLLGRKKKKGEDGHESEEGGDLDLGPEAEAEAEAEPEPKPQKKTRAKAEPEPAPPEEKAAEPDSEPRVVVDEDLEAAAPTESMSEVSAGSTRGNVQEATSGSIGGGSSGASLRAMSSGSLRAASNMIQCNACERNLPVPLAAGVTVTCPFCLGRTAYKP